MTHAENAKKKLDSISGDRISSDMTPTALFEVLEAQTLATLAVADMLERIADRLDKVVYVANANAV